MQLSKPLLARPAREKSQDQWLWNDRFWRKAAIEVQIIRSEWFLLAGSYLVSPMMDWNESLGFSNNYKAACARCVHLDIKENLAMSSVLWLK